MSISKVIICLLSILASSSCRSIRHSITAPVQHLPTKIIFNTKSSADDKSESINTFLTNNSQNMDTGLGNFLDQYRRHLSSGQTESVGRIFKRIKKSHMPVNMRGVMPPIRSLSQQKMLKTLKKIVGEKIARQITLARVKYLHNNDN